VEAEEWIILLGFVLHFTLSEKFSEFHESVVNYYLKIFGKYYDHNLTR